MRTTKDLKPFQTNPESLDTNTIQYWHGGVMLTAQMKLNDAKELVKNKKAFVITSQAIGTIRENLELYS